MNGIDIATGECADDTTDNEAGEHAKEGFLAIVASLENIVRKKEQADLVPVVAALDSLGESLSRGDDDVRCVFRTRAFGQRTQRPGGRLQNPPRSDLLMTAAAARL